ncbi:unnamed protein product [Amoebophrya sp. A120]|nr:unnamed protein product [Amoebophrya sp. A120]|eukprot:GSA120T00019928001.1
MKLLPTSLIPRRRGCSFLSGSTSTALLLLGQNLQRIDFCLASKCSDGTISFVLDVGMEDGATKFAGCEHLAEVPVFSADSTVNGAVHPVRSCENFSAATDWCEVRHVKTVLPYIGATLQDPDRYYLTQRCQELCANAKTCSVFASHMGESGLQAERHCLLVQATPHKTCGVKSQKLAAGYLVYATTKGINPVVSNKFQNAWYSEYHDPYQCAIRGSMPKTCSYSKSLRDQVTTKCSDSGVRLGGADDQSPRDLTNYILDCTGTETATLGFQRFQPMYRVMNLRSDQLESRCEAECIAFGCDMFATRENFDGGSAPGVCTLIYEVPTLYRKIEVAAYFALSENDEANPTLKQHKFHKCTVPEEESMSNGSGSDSTASDDDSTFFWIFPDLDKEGFGLVDFLVYVAIPLVLLYLLWYVYNKKQRRDRQFAMGGYLQYQYNPTWEQMRRAKGMKKGKMAG